MTDLIHDVPETWSDERMHILGDPDDCWCHPTVDGPYIRHNRPPAEGPGAQMSLYQDHGDLT